MLKGLQAKIIAGIVAAAVVVGGVTAAAVLTNQDAVETSADGQEGNTLDVVDAENNENTPELDTQPTETEEPQENEAAEAPETAKEVKTEEVTTPEETEEPKTAETDTEPTAEPEYTYTDMSATMYASQTVNVRDLPSTDGNRLGGLSTNQEVAVTGQCNETGWYRFEYNGQTAYVSNSYVSDTKIEVAAADPAQSASSGSGSSSFNINDYPVSQWIDFGDWFLYIHPVYGERPPFTTIDPEYMDIVNTLQARYPDDKIDWGHGIDVKGLGVSVYFVDRRQASQEELDFMNYVRQFK